MPTHLAPVTGVVTLEQLHEDVAQVRAAVAELRGDFREAIARLEGALQTMAATKTGEHERLRAAVDEESHQRKNLDASVKAVWDTLEKYPRPEEVHKTAQMAASNQLTLAKLVTAITVSSLTGGGVVLSVARAMGWVG